MAPGKRAGFTLIELLVVVAIVAVLMTLAVAGIFGVSEGQRLANTETIMRTLNKTLEQHWSHVMAQAKKESPSPAAMWLANYDSDRAKVIWLKLRLMEAFPVSYAEISDPSDAFNTPRVYQTAAGAPGPWIPVESGRHYMGTYQQILAQAGLTGKGAKNSATESSACLLMSLKVSRGGVKLEADTFAAAALQDTDGDGIPELVDSWGTAFAFFRFVGVTQAGAVDPADPSGTLTNSGWPNQGYVDLVWWNHPAAATFQPIPTPRGAVLVSAGPDRKFGLDSLDAPSALPNTMAVTSAPQDYDNIYSFKLR